MSTILYNTENIGDAYAPSLNAAFEEIYQASGVKPRVIAPYGAASSPAIDRAHGIKGRGPNSDHYKARAVDIANYAWIERVIGRRELQAILARHGWDNVQSNGDPFPTEPWHFANRSVRPQGGTATPLPSQSRRPLGRKKNMNVCRIGDGRGILGGGDHYYVYGPGFWLDLTGWSAESRDVTVLWLCQLDRTGNWLDVANLTYTELLAVAKASGAPAEFIAKLELAA